MSETTVLRKEIHVMHDQLDACQGVIQCMTHAIEKLSMDLAEANAIAERREEQRDEECKRADGYLRKNKALAKLLEDNNIQFDAESLVDEHRTSEQEKIDNLEDALKKERAKNRRVSNENTPSSMGGWCVIQKSPSILCQ